MVTAPSIWRRASLQTPMCCDVCGSDTPSGELANNIGVCERCRGLQNDAWLAYIKPAYSAPFTEYWTFVDEWRSACRVALWFKESER